MKPLFTGACVALITPFNADGSVNFERLGRILDYQINNGTDALLICGTTGEGSTIYFDEKVETFDFCVKRVAGRVPVIAGTGSNSTDYTIKLAVAAEEVGVDAHLMVTPYYNKTSQNGLIKHYFAAADVLDKPVILYNVPSRTGLNIKPETYAQLAKHPNIIATKEANGNLSEMLKTRYLCGDDLDVYVGNDDQIAASIAIGGKGVISVLSNVMPQYVHDMAMLGLSGKMQECAKMQLEALPLIEALFCDVNPIAVKDIMNLYGGEVGPLKLPLCSVSDEMLAEIKKVTKPYSEELIKQMHSI